MDTHPLEPFRATFPPAGSRTVGAVDTVADLLGIDLVLVWDTYGPDGFDGHSLLTVDIDGTLHDVPADVFAFLYTGRGDPDALGLAVVELRQAPGRVADLAAMPVRIGRNAALTFRAPTLDRVEPQPVDDGDELPCCPTCTHELVYVEDATTWARYELVRLPSGDLSYDLDSQDIDADYSYDNGRLYCHTCGSTWPSDHLVEP